MKDGAGVGAAAPDPGALVVVADSVRAQVYTVDAAIAPMREADSLQNPEGRMHERELVSDAGGRRNHRPTKGTASAFGGDSAKAHYAESFAKRICERLGQALDQTPALRIYIVAEPQFLGLLRQRMDQRVQRQIVAELPKALAGRPIDEIRSKLPARL